MSGATTGVAKVKIETHEMARDASSPVQRSRMMARESTIPEDAPKPCNARAATSSVRSVDKAASMAAAE
jgi:hypothetical protein